jgi:serine protease Do
MSWSQKKSNLTLIGAVILALLAGIIIASGLNWTGLSRATDRGTPATSVANTISTPIPLVNEQGESPFVAVAAKVLPTVVNIRTKKTIRVNSPPGFGGPFDDMFKDFFRGMVPRNEKVEGQGSGIIIDRKGLILTNNHVVRDVSGGDGDLIVRLPNDDHEYTGKVIGADPKTDVAVVKLNLSHDLPENRVAVLGNSDNLKVGDWAIAVGNPFSMRGELNGTVTVGVISALGRTQIDLPGGPLYQNAIQTDAAINPGNSGGALVNIRGEVIGLTYAIESPAGGNVGIGFAIPINMARQVAEELIKHGKIVRGYLGIVPQDITQDMVSDLGLKNTEGVVVTNTQNGSPAQRGGLQDGDVIVRFNGQAVTDVPSFRAMVAEVKPGTSVDVGIVRDRKERTLRVKIGEMPEEQVAQNTAPEEKAWLGLSVASLTSGDARQFNSKEKEGVIVTDVDSGSPADDAGIRPGDVITKISTYKIAGLADYDRASKSLKNDKKPITVLLRRTGSSGTGQNLFVVVKP